MNEIVTEEQEILDEARDAKNSMGLVARLVILFLFLALLALACFIGVPI